MNEDKKVEDLPWNQPQHTYWHQYSSNTHPFLLKLFSSMESKHSVKSTHKKSQLTLELVSMRASTWVSMWEGGQNIGNSRWSIFSAPVLETDKFAVSGFLFPLTWPRSSWAGKMWNSVGGFPGLVLWTCNQYATNSHAGFCLQKTLSPLFFLNMFWKRINQTVQQGRSLLCQKLHPIHFMLHYFESFAILSESTVEKIQ